VSNKGATKVNATACNAQRDAVAAMARTFSRGGARGWDGDTRSDIPDDDHLRASHGPILTADDLAVLEAELARQRAADTIAVIGIEHPCIDQA
jgi:hypothetical protein